MSMSGPTSTTGSVGQAGIQQVYAGAGKKAKVATECTHCGHAIQETGGKGDRAWKHTDAAPNGDWGHTPHPKPSYSDEPQQMTDVLGPRPSRYAIFHDRRKK
jgi:hypothetical protein